MTARNGWRPFADLRVARHLEAGPAGDDAELAPADKAVLLGLLHGQVDWEGGRCPLPQAVGRQVEAVRAYYAEKGPLPPFPQLGE